MRRLVYILASSYSGSTLLTLLLANHPEISTIGELKASALGDVGKYVCSCGRPILECRFWKQVGAKMAAMGAEFRLEDFGTHFRASGPVCDRILRASLRGKVFEKMSGKSFAREIPDVEILYDTRYDDIKLQVNPVFIYGRYRKLVRGIPQTRWPCRHCHGKGCEHCNYTGKMYPESVEEIIAAPFMESSVAEEHALHGMGREDIDALMLGTGRPFVLELKNPRRRAFDMDSMESAINSSGKVEAEGLRYSSKAEVRRIKASRAEKTYVVKVEIDPDVDEEKLKNALEMLRTNIKQRTPQRVAHRRADLVRERRVIQIRLLEKEGPVASIEVRGEAGLYIKELMHGDDGRTEPSLASVLGTGCRVLELDVIAIQEKEE